MLGWPSSMPLMMKGWPLPLQAHPFCLQMDKQNVQSDVFLKTLTYDQMYNTRGYETC